MTIQTINGEALDSMCKELAAESIETIDFDELIETLSTVKNKLDRQGLLERELGQLKDEYRNRIVGMLKANLACRESSGDRELAITLSSDLSDVTADDLMRIYNRVAARFRSNFPASFRYVTMPTDSNSSGRNWKEHKI